MKYAGAYADAGGPAGASGGGAVIEAVGTRKSRGAVGAVRGVDLRVPRGSTYWFLGRNGAGKTTTIKTLLGMARPSGGAGRLLGLAAGALMFFVSLRLLERRDF